VSARTRTYVVVAFAAIAAAALVVGAVAVTRTSTGGAASPHTQTNAVARGRAPALALDLGVRTDAEAVALRRANRLYAAGRRRQAEAIFRRYGSVEARVGAALAAWPARTVPRLEALAREHPSSALVLLHLGLAQLANGRTAAARVSWRRAVARDPDTASAVHADELLHPQFAPGLPAFVPSFPLPRAIRRLSPPAQLAALRRGRDARTKLLYGSALQRLGRPVSAEREFVATRRLSPASLEARVAAIVGSFSKSNPSRAFSRLGPMAARYPGSQTVRFHLGELLLWIGQVNEAKRQLKLARAAGPETALGRTANSLLERLGGIRTN
jgi:predicted Zn-dependent protease